MRLEEAFGYINQFPWFEQYLRETTLKSKENDRGALTNLLRNSTRYIAVRPLESLDLTSTRTCCYHYLVPKAEVGAEKPVDMRAFCITSPVTFRLSAKCGSQTVVEDNNFAVDLRLDYSANATFCYRFSDQYGRGDCHFEYLPSTHRIDDAVTDLCTRFGHTHRVVGRGYDYFTDTLDPVAIVVVRQIWIDTFGGIIFLTFDLYPFFPHAGMASLCRTKHKK
jgi:hypothetical protein